jgi:hypothetical protein
MWGRREEEEPVGAVGWLHQIKPQAAVASPDSMTLLPGLLKRLSMTATKSNIAGGTVRKPRRSVQ